MTTAEKLEPNAKRRGKHRFVTVLAALVLVAASIVAWWLVRKGNADGLADGFDFPVGKPNGAGYYIARGFTPNRHPGEDWNGSGGGNSDLGDPVFAIARGEVVFAGDAGKRWGGVVILRHRYEEDNGTMRKVDSFYGHVQNIAVAKGEKVRRGEQIAEIGNAGGLYLAHLRFEIRKNIAIGLDRSEYKVSYANYYSPRSFISAHRPQKTWITRFGDWIKSTFQAITP